MKRKSNLKQTIQYGGYINVYRDIAADYPALTVDDLAAIRAALDN